MFEHFKGEEVFVKKVLDYLDQVQYKQRLILTQFLDPYHQSIVKSVIGHQDEVQVLENGGFIHSESQRMIIAPYFYEIEKEDFEIVVCKIIYAKNFEKLTHRDILGALMSLGIKRELFGDIVEKDQIIAMVDEMPVYASLTGVLRGIIRDGYKVPKGMKIADIDPRKEQKKNCNTISDKARCIAGSVVEVLMANGVLP